MGERIFSLVRLAASHVFPGARAALCVTPHDCRPCHVCVGPACAWGGRWYQQSGRIESSYLGNAELLRLRQLIIRRGTSPVVAATRGGRHPYWNAPVCPTEGGGGRCRGRRQGAGRGRRQKIYNKMTRYCIRYRLNYSLCGGDSASDRRAEHVEQHATKSFGRLAEQYVCSSK